MLIVFYLFILKEAPQGFPELIQLIKHLLLLLTSGCTCSENLLLMVPHV